MRGGRGAGADDVAPLKCPAVLERGKYARKFKLGKIRWLVMKIKNGCVSVTGVEKLNKLLPRVSWILCIVLVKKLSSAPVSWLF